MTLSRHVALPDGGDPLFAFDVAEDHPNWAALSSPFHELRASDVPRTEFTTTEVESARWLQIGGWHHGYPRPDDDHRFLDATYDLAAWCETCGIGAKQKAPFRMEGEPLWRRNVIMQLVWVYGELFVTPEVWDRVFKPAGIGSQPVLDTNGATLETAVQLVVPSTTSIVTDGLIAERCERCSRTKYRPVTRGPFPPLRGTPDGPMVHTTEYLGSGAQADQRVLISRALARSLAAAGVRGASLTPVAHA